MNGLDSKKELIIEKNNSSNENEKKHQQNSSISNSNIATGSNAQNSNFKSNYHSLKISDNIQINESLRQLTENFLKVYNERGSAKPQQLWTNEIKIDLIK